MKKISFCLIFTLFTVSIFGTPSKDDFYNAVIKGDINKVKECLQSGFTVQYRNLVDSTPLHWASEFGQVEIMKLFISQGADVNARDMKKWIPLHNAAWRGRTEAARLLIQHGANVNAKGGIKNTSGIDINETPLHLAAEGGFLDLVKVFVENKAEIDPVIYNGYTPLFYAVDKAKKEVVSYLISKGADINHVSKDEENTTPIFLAVGCGYISTAKLLIDNGADIFKKNLMGETPYDFVLKLRRKKEAEFLKPIMDEKKKT